MRRFFAPLLAPLIVAAFLAGRASGLFGREPEPAYGGGIVAASIADARNLIPILASDSASAEICSLVYNGLVKYDKDLTLIGDLAERWEIRDNGLVIVFYLKKNVRWHDGMPFTARDVEFTYEKLIDPKVKTPYSGDFERVRSLEVLDDHTVQVTYKEPFSPGLASWGVWIMPRHLLAGEDLNTTGFARHPVGTGPFIFGRWKTGEVIELAANRDYFEGRPYLDRYLYRVIPDTATIFLELLTGNTDMAGLTPLQFAKQTGTRRFTEHNRKFLYPAFAYTYLGYNLDDPLFADKRVRQAINYGVDKREIINGVLHGMGRLATGPFTPESWAHDAGVEPAEYDPVRARMLLTEAGWADMNKDGWLEKDGQVFEFTILTNQGNLERMQCAEIIQRRLKDIGIKVKIKVVEWSALLNEFINKKDFEAVVLGWSLAWDPDCYDIWHSSKTRPGEFNFLGYKNPELDRLLDEGRRTFDQKERARIYHAVQRLLYEDQPCLFLYVPDTLVAVNRRFRGVAVAPIGIGYNLIKWYVPKDEQKYRFQP